MNLTDVLSTSVRVVPTALIEVVGIVLSVVRWPRHSLVSMLFVAARRFGC